MSEKNFDQAAEPANRRKSRWGLDEGDLTLIDEMLARTPEERLRAMQSAQNSLVRLKQNARRVSSIAGRP